VSHWNVDNPEIRIFRLFRKIKIRIGSSSREDFKFCDFFRNFSELEPGEPEKGTKRQFWADVVQASRPLSRERLAPAAGKPCRHQEWLLRLNRICGIFARQ
jgi:hypothetical protein